MKDGPTSYSFSKVNGLIKIGLKNGFDDYIYLGEEVVEVSETRNILTRDTAIDVGIRGTDRRLTTGAYKYVASLSLNNYVYFAQGGKLASGTITYKYYNVLKGGGFRPPSTLVNSYRNDQITTYTISGKAVVGRYFGTTYTVQATTTSSPPVSGTRSHGGLITSASENNHRYINGVLYKDINYSYTTW